MSPSKLKPFMAYIDDGRLLRLRQLSKKNKTPMSQLVREGIDARLAVGDKYLAGHNDGIKSAIGAVNANDACKMQFPSGKTFAELLTDDLQKLVRTDQQEK